MEPFSFDFSGLLSFFSSGFSAFFDLLYNQIIVPLIALLLPAVQSAREAA